MPSLVLPWDIGLQTPKFTTMDVSMIHSTALISSKHNNTTDHRKLLDGVKFGWATTDGAIKQGASLLNCISY